MAARAAPIAMAAPSIALAAPLTVIPKSIFDDQTVRLGDRFRASQPTGQNSVIVERRVDDGLLGTGVGAKWEELPPLGATLRVGRYGLRTLVVDADRLQEVVGPEGAKQLFGTGLVIDRQADEFDAANRTRTASGGLNDPPPQPLSVPPKIEMRIGVSTDRGVTTVPREATREEVQQVCPNFPEYERYAADAAARYKALGYPNGLRYGQLVHQSVEKELLGDIQSRLKEKGLVEMAPELALHDGIPNSYDKGSSRLDVLELHRDHITVCVYEIKTGGATVPREVMLRYVREAGIYARATGLGYEHVYFIPIHVP
jgi:hypothetical protein